MAHHPYNTTMLRHAEWAKPHGSGTVQDMLQAAAAASNTAINMVGTSVSTAPVVTATATPGTSVQWPAAASELCEVVLTECLRQQHTVSVVAAHQQTHHAPPPQPTATVVTTASSTGTITQDHEVRTVPTQNTIGIEDVIRGNGDMNSLHNQTLLAPGTTLTLPLQVVSTSTSSKSRRHSHVHHVAHGSSPHHHHNHHNHHNHSHNHHGHNHGHHNHHGHNHNHHNHHHHHHHHHFQPMQDKYLPYPGRYRLPSSELLPNHEELVAAGAIPASTPQSLVIDVVAPPAPSPAPRSPPSRGRATTKQRKPRASKGRNNQSKKKPSSQDGSSQPPAPVQSTSTYPCPDCGKKFLWASRMIVHRRSHTGEKPFPCHLCGAAFAQRWILAVHMRTHNPPEIQAEPEVQLDDGQIEGSPQPLLDQQDEQQQQQQVEI